MVNNENKKEKNLAPSTAEPERLWNLTMNPHKINNLLGGTLGALLRKVKNTKTNLSYNIVQKIQENNDTKSWNIMREVR